MITGSLIIIIIIIYQTFPLVTCECKLTVPSGK